MREKTAHKESGHDHDHEHTSEKNRYILLFLVAIATFIAQTAFGRWAGSIAVISDAFHTLMHSIGFLLNVRVAHVIANLCGKGASEKHMRKKRAEYGFANAIILLLGIGIICAEAYKKLIHPEEIIGIIMVVGACIGILGNSVSLFILHKNSAVDEIYKWSLAHVFLDLGESVVILLSAPIILFFHLIIIDSILSFAIAGIMLFATVKLLFTQTLKNL